jgi:hypothetical protein
MRCRCWMVLVAILPLGAIGCGSSGGAADSPADGQAAEAHTAAAQGPGTQRTASAPLSGPAAAVFDFLEAVRTGNDRKAAAMLTTTARTKTAEMNMEVAPAGSDTASFEVGEVKYLPEGRASVACKWSDRDEKGQTHTEEVTWILREEKQGWRVGGMVATVAGMSPTFLNFEDPQEMVRQQQRLQEEMRRQTTEAQAQRPQEPPTGENPIRR